MTGLLGKRTDTEYCEAHDYEWDRVNGVSCLLCKKLRQGTMTPDESLEKWRSPPAPGGMNLEQGEALLTRTADEWLAISKRLMKPTGKRGRPSHRAPIEAGLLALKAAKQALRLCQIRERRDYVEHLRLSSDEARRKRADKSKLAIAQLSARDAARPPQR